MLLVYNELFNDLHIVEVSKKKKEWESFFYLVKEIYFKYISPHYVCK